ncbi:outer membrane protein assembly factor BamB family protein [Streptomyces sp. NBC_00388]|uniref:outer membrane protein assembly factor BamB family protein n=1 Tax=Streptomyces sp. NBC_00388 TaxID=2975735 RepID=UPI002E1CB5DE
MTQPPQPPQPPNGPPQGGFGAPKDSPAGGYGAPTPPPNSPPVPPQMPPGAPQTPPPPQGPPPAGPPAAGPPQHSAPQDPGYGYPQTAPAGPGYGYPQQQQPGGPAYGFPQQQQQPGVPAYQQYPTQPMQPQPGSTGGGGKFGIDAKIITAAAVAIVLIIAAGFVYASGKDSDAPNVSSAGPTGGGDKNGDTGKGAGGKEKVPADTNSRVLFQMPAPKVKDVTAVNGSWTTDKLYVKSGVDEVVGYDAVKGTQVWKLPLPGPLCAATSHVSKDHKTAIAFQPKVPTKAKPFWGCSEIAALDLDSGKLLWQKSYNDGDRKASVDEVTLGADTVATGSTSGGAAWGLEKGELRWSPKVSTDQCEDAGYAGGPTALVAVRKCGDYDSPQVSVQNLNPKTGAPLSTFKMPSGVEYAHIVSAAPLVVAADVGDTAGDGSGISDYFSVDAKTGKLRARIPAEGDKYAGKCDSTEVEQCNNLAVGDDRLYVPTEQHDGVGDAVGQTNEIVAFDLGTGKPVPGRADAGPGYTSYPVRMDGSNVLAYKTGPYNKGGQVVSINGTTLKQTLLMNNPGEESVRGAESSFVVDSAEIRYSEGRLYLADDMLSEFSGDSEKHYLAIAFGTG